MKAAVFLGTRNISIEDVPEPVPQEEETLATVQAVGVCGSEIEAYVGSSAKRRPPLIFGHEISVAIPGQPQIYVVNPLRICGICDRCRSGESNLCSSRSLMSLHRNGGLAEKVLVRTADLIPVSAGVSAVVAAVAEPAATAQHALDVVGGLAGKSVLIIGCGSLGLLAVQIAVASGASEVIACDIVGSRRDLAAGYGARAVKKVGREVKVDVVVEMVGADATRRLAIESCRAGGDVRLVGLLSQETTLPFDEVIARGLRVEGIYAYRPDHFHRVIMLMEAGKIDPVKMITIKRLDDAPEVFGVLATDPGMWVKVVMQP